MSSDETRLSEPSFQFSKSRSFPNILSDFFFNHNLWSPPATDHSQSDVHHMMTMAGQGNANDLRGSSSSHAIQLSSRFEADNLNWMDSNSDFMETTASSLRRNDTSPELLQRQTEVTHNALHPNNTTSAGNRHPAVIQRSFSDIFTPNRVIVDTRDRFMGQEIDDEPKGFSFSARSSRPPPLSMPSGETEVNNTPVNSPKSKSLLKHQMSLTAVPELDSNQGGDDHSPQHNGLWPADALTKSRSTTLDENQNIIVPRTPDGRLTQKTSGEPRRETAELTSSGHVMHEAESPPLTGSGHSRRFGILEFLASGERRNVRNKDVNLMAPQSW